MATHVSLIYTRTTMKLQRLVTQPEGKNLIQALRDAALGEHRSSACFQTLINRTSMPVPQQPNMCALLAFGPVRGARGMNLLAAATLCSIPV